MLRKSLVIGSIVLMLVMLFALAGCENPASGSDGPQGAQGPTGSTGKTGQKGPDGIVYFIGPNVTEGELDAAFDVNNYVSLRNTVEDVYGEVPPGKTLYVEGGYYLKVLADKTLKVDGTLEIKAGSVFNAAGITADAGFLTGTGEIATVDDGFVLLPYDVEGLLDPADGVITYMSENVSGLSERAKRVGSTVRTVLGIPSVVRVDGPGVAAIFALPDSPSSLTVPPIADIVSESVPTGKTLTLTSDPNPVAAATFSPVESTLDNNGNVAATFNVEGDLIIEGRLLTTSTGGTKIQGGRITIAPNGRFDLADDDDDILTDDPDITNQGILSTNVPANTADLVSIIDVVRGKIEVRSDIDTVSAVFTIPSDVELIIANSGSTFSTGDFELTVTGTLTVGTVVDPLYPSTLHSDLGAVSVAGFTPVGNVTVGGTLKVNTNSIVTIATTKVLTIASERVKGGGGITAIGAASGGTITIDGTTLYTTTASPGVAPDNIPLAVEAFSKEAVLTNTAISGLGAYVGTGVSSDLAIGSITLGDTTATPLRYGHNGSLGPNLKFTTSTTTAPTTIAGFVNPSGGSGPDYTELTTGGTVFTNFVLSSNSGEVLIADSGFTPTDNPSRDKHVLFNFTGVKLQNRNLISPNWTEFSVAVYTKR
jgi:hypothetical protein